jgi:hypothetical protein
MHHSHCLAASFYCFGSRNSVSLSLLHYISRQCFVTCIGWTQFSMITVPSSPFYATVKPALSMLTRKASISISASAAHDVAHQQTTVSMGVALVATCFVILVFSSVVWLHGRRRPLKPPSGSARVAGDWQPRLARGGSTVGAFGVQLSPKISGKTPSIYISFNTLYMYNTLLNTIASLLSPYNSPNTLPSLLSWPNNNPVPNCTTRILMYKLYRTAIRNNAACRLPSSAPPAAAKTETQVAASLRR